MQLTLLTHLSSVKVLLAVGITFIVLPIIFYIIRKKAKLNPMQSINNAVGFMLFLGIVVILPSFYYVYLDRKFDIGDYSKADILYVAAQNDELGAVKRMLKQGANPSEPTRFGECSFYSAADRGDVEMAQLMLDHGADVNFAEGDKTPLGAACRRGYTETARFLLENGADPDYMPEKYISALNCAASGDEGYDYRLIELLCSYGADPASVCIDSDGRKMLPFKFYFDKSWDKTLTNDEQEAYDRIAALLERPYVEWVMKNADFLIEKSKEQ